MAPTTLSIEARVRSDYNKHLEIARQRGVNPERWIAEFERVYQTACEYRIPEVQGSTATLAFLDAVGARIEPTWAKTKSYELSEALQRGQDPPSLDTLRLVLNDIVASDRTRKANPGLYPTQGSGRKPSGSRKSHPCPCGRPNHFWKPEDCYSLKEAASNCTCFFKHDIKVLKPIAMSTSPSFATPLPQSPRSDILEWRFPKPYDHLTLTGRSRAAWHTSFVIPQLNLLLDAGLCVNNLRPKQIFLTHGHSDHTLLTPAFVKRDDPPDIFCPAEMKDALDTFINAKTILNEGGLWSPSSQPESSDEIADDDKPFVDPKLRTHITHPLQPGQTVPLHRLPGYQPPSPTSTTSYWTATAFPCDHTVPCLGYIFTHVTHKLRPEYRSLSGPELRALRQQQQQQQQQQTQQPDSPPHGTNPTPSPTSSSSSSSSQPPPPPKTTTATLTHPVPRPVFAFLGDTTARTLAADPLLGRALGSGLAVVVTECSFLHEAHRAQADRTRHTAWADLEPVVRRWPGTVFVLTHFSLRYSDEEVRAFFRGVAAGSGQGALRNVVVWVDGGAE
ncbi:hypothetical protein VTK26DRAFT_3946 [Humicola hyalothermophila]